MRTPLLLSLLLTGCLLPVDPVVDAEPDRVILLRSAQPSAEDLLELHSEYQIKSVLNLRGVSPNKTWFVSEAEGIKALGIRWFHLDLSGRQEPTLDQINNLFSILENPDNYPILVHCAGGIHRTGLVVALYRIRIRGWSSKRALQELENNWFNWSMSNRQAIKDYLHKFAALGN